MTQVLSGTQVNASIKDPQCTPLTLATRCNDVKAVRQLIDHRADVNLPERNKLTALYLSVWYDVPEIAVLLLEFGADINLEIGELYRCHWADLTREAMEKAQKWQLTN
ncbi:MAG: ankyrin repeat domain-containing protein [Patescibacteria group bacterium]|nr:ankyrin repeat domain-containing protein [Patescibacteria group bacterium]